MIGVPRWGVAMPLLLPQKISHESCRFGGISFDV
jgi:hypothetical protein